MAAGADGEDLRCNAASRRLRRRPDQLVRQRHHARRGEHLNQSPAIALTAPANGAQFTAPVDVTLTANASDADGTVTRVEFFNSGVKLGQVTNAPFTFVWSNAPLGTHTLTAKASDSGLALTESPPVVITIRQPVLTNLTLVPFGSVWRYHDKGQNLGTNWLAPAYNDAGWSNGLAQLGYGDDDEATVVSYGPNAGSKYITTYFRRAFVFNAPVPAFALILRVVRDDGIIVRLNGRDVFRDNMPPGPFGFTTLASSSLGPPLESAVIETNPPPGALAAGTNILAVEIHQGAVDSGDISFDLELVATLIQPEPQFTLIVSGGVFRLLWPAPAGPFHLEQTTNFTPPVTWSAAGDSVSNDGYWNQVRVTNNPASSQRFFRLHRD